MSVATMTDESLAYLTNYNTLRETVGQIQGMTEPDVDALVPLVEKATQARGKCMARIEAVEKLLALEPITDQSGA